MKLDDYVARGATFDIEAIKEALASENWEEDLDDAFERRQVYLGSVFSCTPSGKFYMPWACSNVEPCPLCRGEGSIGAHKSERVRKRNKSRYERAVRLAVKRGRAYALRRSGTRQRWMRAYQGATCTLCNGLGSAEAAADEEWRERWEERFAEAGLSLESGEGDPCDLFAVEVRGVEEASEEVPDDDGAVGWSPDAYGMPK